MTWDERTDNILEPLGHTLAVKIGRLAPSDPTRYVKIKAFNPSGSVNFHLAPTARAGSGGRRRDHWSQ